jgi:DNA-binding beta-propeller fold protein YncE
VAVFRIRPDGSLSLVHGAPFKSGGTQPVSLTIDQGRLYVTNRSDEIQGQTGTVPPTISVFNIDKDGSLDPIKSATVTLPQGLSPSQLLPSLDGKVLFADAFTPPPLLNVSNSNSIVPFTVGKDGKLTAGTPIASPATPPLLLGLAQHPTKNIIYAGLTAASEIGVFTYDSTGTLTLASTVPVQGTAPCWTIVSADGQTLYSIDTATNSVGVFSLADALHPKQIQEFALGGPQNIANDPTAAKQTADFEFALDPSGKSLYVIGHETTAGFANGNAVHALSIAADGTLSENSGPSFLPASLAAVGARPDGIATVALRHGNHDDHGRGVSDAIARQDSSDTNQSHGARADSTVTVSTSGGIQSIEDAVSAPNFAPTPDAILQMSPHKPIDVSLADASL